VRVGCHDRGLEHLVSKPSPESKSPDTAAFLWFARLWGASAIVQQLIYLGGPDNYWTHGAMGTPFGFLVLGSAILLFLTRSSVLPLALYAAVQMVQCLGNMPTIPNHVMLEGSINVTILLALLVAMVRERTLLVAPETLFRLFAPPARVQIILLYLIAVLHKMNHDFFDIEWSAVTWILIDVRDRFPVPESPVFVFAMITIAMLFEVVIPILFMFKRTRLAGILAGLLFHVPLALHSLVIVASFTIFLMPCFFLFAPGTLVRTGERIDVGLKRITGIGSGLFRIMSLLLVIAVAWSALGRMGFDPPLLRAAVFFCTLALIGIISLWYLLSIGTAWFGARRRVEPSLGFLRPAPLLWLVPVILVLNGFLPYLGSKTELTFSMYSNLRVEGGVSNHLFMPGFLKFFDDQDDLVTIRSSSIKWINDRADARQLLNHHELRRRVQMVPGPWEVVFLRDDELSRSALDVDGSYVGDRSLIEPLSWFEETFLTYRIVDAEGPMKSRH
jgi:hypothetical protein